MTKIFLFGEGWVKKVKRERGGGGDQGRNEEGGSKPRDIQPFLRSQMSVGSDDSEL